MIFVLKCPEEQASMALLCAKEFLKDYPDRPIGIRHGVGYSTARKETFYVYRTKTSIAVSYQK